MKKLLILLLGLGGCSSGPADKPVGVGSHRDHLTPAPCCEGDPFYVDGQWI